MIVVTKGRDWYLNHTVYDSGNPIDGFVDQADLTDVQSYRCQITARDRLPGQPPAIIATPTVNVSGPLDNRLSLHLPQATVDAIADGTYLLALDAVFSETAYEVLLEPEPIHFSWNPPTVTP